MNAPVCIFTWCRYEHLKRTIEALKQNYLAKDTEIYVCSNAAIKPDEVKVVEKIRKYVSKIDGFKKVTLISNEVNRGYTENLLKNVNKILDVYGKIIVLEEDMETNSNFLDFMNQALEFYKDYPKIQQIGGYCIPVDINCDFDTYFIPRSCSWSWGTWKDKWETINWTPTKEEWLSVDKKKFSRAGDDMTFMLNDVIAGRLEAWDITSDYTIYKNQMYTAFPCKSFMYNIGMDGTGDHCPKTNKFIPIMEYKNKRTFNFCKDINLNKKILKQYKKFYAATLKTKLYKKLSKFESLVKIWHSTKKALHK